VARPALAPFLPRLKGTRHEMLMLDFSQSTQPRPPVVFVHPEYYIQGNDTELARAPGGGFARVRPYRGRRPGIRPRPHTSGGCPIRFS